MILVNADRLRADFDELAGIGQTPDGGVTRSTFSDAHLEARKWFLRRAADAGLRTSVDSAGNHSALLPGGSSDGRTVLLGSHLDTVPAGGRYDGALGVLAALEGLRAIADAGLVLPVSLEAIDFTDEEGSLMGLLGSRALAGTLTPEMLTAARGGREALLSALERAGLSEQQLGDARRDPDTIAGYLELHIEQGPVLERERVDIGVVTAIAGSRSYRIAFKGERRHAGTTPMDVRRDALLGAARFAIRVRDMVMEDFPDCVGTVGSIEVDRAAVNAVPGHVRVRLELRAPEPEPLDSLEEALFALTRRDAEAGGLELEIARAGRWDPVELDPSVQSIVEGAADELGLSSRRLMSGAGHDAQAIAQVARAGMIFVPSVGGISHDPAEYTRWRDCVNGANVLLAAALSVARAGA